MENQRPFDIAIFGCTSCVSLRNFFFKPPQQQPYVGTGNAGRAVALHTLKMALREGGIKYVALLLITLSLNAIQRQQTESHWRVEIRIRSTRLRKKFSMRFRIRGTSLEDRVFSERRLGFLKLFRLMR